MHQINETLLPSTHKLLSQCVYILYNTNPAE